MALDNLLDTNTVSFSDIVGNGKKYSVPPYQRDYSWEKDQWEDLWNDILSIEQSGNVHYMGSIVLQNMGDKNYHVIDGQQRLATLTILVLAIINKLNSLIDAKIDENQNAERKLILQRKFIGDKDAGSLTYSSKLSLNENNDSFFQANILVFRKPTNIRTLIDSDKLIWAAYTFFENKISKLFLNKNKGEDVSNFLDKIIAEKLMFIQIVVEDELSAYTVFETLNSRGVGLTVTDLLKNYLFSISAKVDLPHVKTKWKNIVNVIGLDSFPVFLRHYWISKFPLIRQDYLFRAIKDSITTSQNVIELLDSLEQNALLYNAFTNYADSIWRGNRELKDRIKELTLFKEKQAFPLLIAAYNNFDITNFSRIVKFVSIITFRYTIISKLHTNLKEDAYNKVAVKISNKKIVDIQQIADGLKTLYPTDKEFKNNFSTKTISTKRGKKLARYILFKLENHLNSTNHDYEINPATIEHILPEKGNTNYLEDFPESIHEAFVYRLGNYSLLEADKNRLCSDLSFKEKKEIYATSGFKLSNTITTNTWTPNTLEKRQDQLARYATSIWRIAQLSQ